MSHPGPDGTPSDPHPGHPGQPEQPAPYGQQPGGPAQPGQPGAYDQQPGPYQPFGQAGQPGQPGQPGYPGQPGQPTGAWVPPQSGATPTGQPDKKGGALKKVLPIVGGVVLVGAAVAAFGLLGGDPEVGDCVQNVVGEEVEVVDCDSDEAEAKIIGIDEQELDRATFMAPDQEVCTDFPNALDALWVGADPEEPGTIYCAEPV
jgi:hypothetical protein